ncbi:hypothetical protein LTR53_004838 [Teratosphaeriaceae sp. CCFEE 6253]|nr:hypothetical protein LTR53_004838 [Teratosphaeriaceae sp. CCFEE 6253]
MEDCLERAINKERLQCRQAMLLASVDARLIDSNNQPALPPVFHTTDSAAAKLLMTPMRNAKVSGPRLQDAHRQAVKYLAIEFVAKIVGLEEYKIQHIQPGKTTDGFRLRDEHRTTISTVILVDSVINTGKSIVEFVNHVRKMEPEVRIVIVTGVVQARNVQFNFKLRSLLLGDGNISVVALRPFGKQLHW